MKPKPIDADKLFDRVLEMLDDTEIDVGAVDKFMDLVNVAPTIVPPPNAPLTLEVVHQLKFCGYECEGGPLGMNIAFIRLKELACRRKPEEATT